MDDRLCLLVILGVTEHGRKELVAVEDGFREPEDSWYELLAVLRSRGLTKSPKLAVGDGVLGFWKALSKCYPDTHHQRCRVHKTANVLKAVQPKIKVAFREIWIAEIRENARKAFDEVLLRFRAKYLGTMECLSKSRRELLAFYDFPAEHWIHIWTANPIESTFATARLRTNRTRNCGSRVTTLSMVFKVLESAQKRWRKIQGFRLLILVVNNVTFKDGIQIADQLTENVA